MTPSEGDRAASELSTAEQVASEAALLLGAGMLEGAVSRLYYAAFHAARAALSSRGRSAKTHSGLISQFTSVFGPAPVMGRLFDLRNRADYGEEPFRLGAATPETIFAEAADFLERCRKLVADRIAQGADEPDPPPDR